MSFKVTYGQLRDDVFNGAIEKLIGYREYNDHQLTYNVAKINRRLEAEHKIMRAALDKLTKQYVETDERGDYIWAEGRFGQMKPKSPEHHDQYNAELEKFDAVEVDIDCHKLKLQLVAEQVKLSPQEIMAIEPMLCELSGPPKVVPKTGKTALPPKRRSR